jgi:acyl-[acyl-carrier-protein]-phospholipid O-acyltransferase / long-chain-fatty-acid--[acyl-carrier-protein] ligase
MLASVLRIICKFLFRVKVRGLENVPAEDGLLIVANHESFLDGLLLCLFLPKKATFVVHTSTFKKWAFRQALRLTRHVEVDTANPIAMKKVIKLLESGENVVVFPEGRVTATGEIQKVYDGPGFIAGKAGATVLPVRIDGAAESYFGRLSRHQLKRLFPQVTLTVLPTTNIVMPKATNRSFPTGKQRRRIAGEGMRSVMQKMLCHAKNAVPSTKKSHSV